jgi:hypothetical protein
MTETACLKIAYRRGKIMVGYLTLPGCAMKKAAYSRKAEPGMVVDYDESDVPIGIEIVSPSIVSPQAVNDVLVALHQQPLKEEELAPLAKV